MSLATLPGLRAPAVRDACIAYLLAVADDELILGHRHAEWTGFAPDIESDVALSSIAQDEIGHARLFYEQVAGLAGGDPDALAYDRAPGAFRNAVLVERPNDDWAFTIVRMFLYDHADAVRLEALATGSAAPLADLAGQLRREERYHLMYGEQWLRRLAGATADSRDRVRRALAAAWPEAAALFAPVEGQEVLFAPVEGQGALRGQGVMGVEPAAQLGRWRDGVLPMLAEMGLQPPAEAAAGSAANGRQGHHTEHLDALLDEMTSVWRSEPGARW